MRAKGRNWTDSEVMHVIDLYVITPFSKMQASNPQVQELATNLDRTNASIALKMVNLASIDQTLDKKGMAHATKRDKRIWKQFFAELTEQTRNLSTSDEEQDIIRRLPAGLNIPIIANVRQGQDKFRKIVLSSYDEKCAITGISNAELLVAGHIVPWALDADNRMNLRNGICLNRLHDKAYEDGLITIMPNLTIAYSSKLNDATKQQIKVMNGSGVFKAPGRFPPDPIFLEYHRDIIFKV